MKQIKLVNLEAVTEEEAAEYSRREAARAIVFDENNSIALLHATKNGYFKLPGGGIEKGEDTMTALKRECREEIGCDIEVIKELGVIREYRKKYKLNQISYCFIAKVIGSKGIPHLMEDEIAEGFEVVWMPIAEAKTKVAQGLQDMYEAPYMISRDLAFIEEAMYQQCVGCGTKLEQLQQEWACNLLCNYDWTVIDFHGLM